MPSSPVLVQEQSSHKGFSSTGVKITNSLHIFCKFLIDNALWYGIYCYPSLNTFKFDENLPLSSRTIDRLVSYLVKTNILNKFLRSITQAYQVNINSSLLRIILNIYHPDFQIEVPNSKMKVTTGRIKPLQKGKDELTVILDQLESAEKPTLVLYNELLNCFVENSTLSDDELNKKLSSIIKERCEVVKISKFSILQDFLEKLEG